MNGNQEVFDDSIKTLKIECLYLSAFVLHAAWCFVIANIDTPPVIKNFSEWVNNTYHIVGFDWTNTGVIVVAAGIFSGFLLNAIRRIIEGTIFGCARFDHHDRNSCAWSWIRVVAYLALVFFSLGIFGEKYSKSLDVLDLMLVAIGTFLFGVVVNVIDDAFYSTVIVFKGLK